MQEIWTGPRHCGDQCLRLHRGSKNYNFQKEINGSQILPDDTGKSSVCCEPGGGAHQAWAVNPASSPTSYRIWASTVT